MSYNSWDSYGGKLTKLLANSGCCRRNTGEENREGMRRYTCIQTWHTADILTFTLSPHYMPSQSERSRFLRWETGQQGQVRGCHNRASVQACSVERNWRMQFLAVAMLMATTTLLLVHVAFGKTDLKSDSKYYEAKCTNLKLSWGRHVATLDFKLIANISTRQ